MSLTPGTRLGTYEILSSLGAGGMGEVYRARDTRLGRDVAVKVLPAEVSANAGRLERFEREARTVAGLNHPNIVTLFSVEDEDGVRFLTMELVEGQTLSDVIMPGGLPFARLLELAIPLTDALTAAHERGVIHRDLKPGNVMVTREGRVKVLDFGLAKTTDNGDAAAPQLQTVDAPLSAAGHVVGTAPYMAPEQLRGEAVDSRADLFALGILLYELATGRRPFTGETSIDVSHAILRDTPEPLTRVRTDLAQDFERIVARCLEKNPRERAQSALDVSNELRRLRRGLEHAGAGKPAPEKVASIAVLPFVNRSRDEDDEYFSDGLADELLNVLARIKGLRVTARSSAFHFKGKGATIAEVGSALNVATVLEGSVRKSGNRIRVSVQLVNVADSSHLWSETYDRTLEDIFAVQDDIAQSVVKELRTTLLGETPDSDASGQAKAAVAQAAKGRGTDPEAHRLDLLARHLIDRASREDTARAIEYLQQALARDPEFALAWAHLANAYSLEAKQGWTPTMDGIERARIAVERALALEPDLAEAHAERAWIRLLSDWDWPGARESIRRAMELAPGSARVLSQAGTFALSPGRVDEMIDLSRRSLALDPLSPRTSHNLGYVLHQADRNLEAEQAFRRGLELAPQMTGSHAFLSLVLLALGRRGEARAEAMREPDEGFRLYALALIHHALGEATESDAALRELTEKYAADAAYQIAEVHAARGEADAAFEWLETAQVQHDGGMTHLAISAILRSLHGDPRWRVVLKKMGFEDSGGAQVVKPR